MEHIVAVGSFLNVHIAHDHSSPLDAFTSK